MIKIQTGIKKEQARKQNGKIFVHQKKAARIYQSAQKNQQNEGQADFYTTASLRETITKKCQTHCSNSWCHHYRIY